MATAQERSKTPLNPIILHVLGVALIFAGLLIILLAVFLLCFENIKGEGKAKGGGIILIGPIPIVFGTDRKSILILTLLCLMLVIVMTVFYFMSA